MARRGKPLQLFLTDEERAQLQALADSDGRSLTGFVLATLQERLSAAQEPQPGTPPERQETTPEPAVRRPAYVPPAPVAGLGKVMGAPGTEAERIKVPWSTQPTVLR